MSTTFPTLPSSRPMGANTSRSMTTDALFQSMASPPSTSITERPSSSASSTEATLAHMEQIRLMLMGMSERLQSGEERLQQAVDRAEQEKNKLEAMVEAETGVSA